MTTIHMETEQVRQIANQMRDIASQILTANSALRSTAGSLSSGWQGGNAEQYLQSFSNLRRGSENQVQSLENLASRLSREADEWESVDSQSVFRNASSSTGVIGPGAAATSANDANDDGFLSIISSMLEGAGLGLDAGTIAVAIGIIRELAMAGESAEEIRAALDANPELRAIDSIGIGLAVVGGGVDFIDMFMKDLKHYTNPQDVATAAIVDASFVVAVTGLTMAGEDVAMDAIISGLVESATGVGAVAGLPSIAVGVGIYAGIEIDNWLVNQLFTTPSVHDWLVQQVANALPSGGSGGGAG